VKLFQYSCYALLILCLALAPVSVSAAGGAVTLQPVASVEQGGTVTITGTADLNEIIIQVLRPGNAGTVYYDVAKVTDGGFSVSFKLRSIEAAGTYKVIAGQADRTATGSFEVTAAPGNPGGGTDNPPGGGTDTGGGTDNPPGGGTGNPPGNPPTGSITGPGAPAEPELIGRTNGGEPIATATLTEVNGLTVLTAKVDTAKLIAQLRNAGNRPVIVVPVLATADRVTAELTNEAVAALEGKNAVLEINTPIGTYKLPAAEIGTELLAALFGGQVDAADITIRVDIAKSDAATVERLNNAAKQGGFRLVVPPIEFMVTASIGDRSVTLDTFQSFVEREIPLPAGVDVSQVTTAVVLNEDGTTRSVPTKFVTRSGVTYAVINSLTNSTYSLIGYKVDFRDTIGHWANDAIRNMGERMVIGGTGNGLFQPGRDITRAEFAAIVVRALGLKPAAGTGGFSDVKDGDWFSGVVHTAHAQGLINGMEDGTFRPNDKITREQAMVILSKAMALVELEGASPEQAPKTLAPFTDADDVSAWAKRGVADSVHAGIVSGRSAGSLAPKAFIKRAEVAAVAQRLLSRANLI